MRIPVLTQQRLKELVTYDPETGLFTWQTSCGGRSTPGRRAGAKKSDGYIVIGLDGGAYQAHRLAWLYVHGRWPNSFLDHMNGNKSDNRIGNLRLATNTQNHQNVGITRSNTSGFKGVRKLRKKWQAQIRANGRWLYLGVYPTPEEAAAAYKEAAAKYHGEFARVD